MSVNGELAEAVSEVLARFAPNGVATEQGVRYADSSDQGTAAGPITVCAYLPVDEQLDDRRARIEEAIAHLRMIQAIPALSFKFVPDQNWMEAWKQHYRPIPIGRRLMIVPAWLDHHEAGRVAVKIDPGMAFGTGTHPSTQLCLEFLESLIDPLGQTDGGSSPGEGIRVIDVGCGSGILSIAALKLGAVAALGVDIDNEAIENARRNAHINGVGREMELAQGSLQEILAGKFSMSVANVVTVNILAPVIIRLLQDGLAAIVEPHGAIVLSGILEDQAADVIAAAGASGLHLRETRQIADWVALLVGN